jgi:nucleotide-binding universal stress UspA family protein
MCVSTPEETMNIDIVLCPIDFSELAERELQLAVQVCEAFGARLVLHHNLSAISPGFSKAWEWDQSHQKDERSAADAERRMKELLAQLPRTIRAEAAITHGPVATVLLALAEQIPADLLVLGTHGWSSEDHASVTERILERAPCPVLTIHDVDALAGFRLRPGADGKAARVVVATDFSPAATRAVAYAVELARRLPLELHVVHVSAGPLSDETLETLIDSVPPELTDRVQVHARSGRTVEEIDAVLHIIRPALMVMGTHAHGFWRRFFTTDTARTVLHGASCPVLFVPPA